MKKWVNRSILLVMGLFLVCVCGLMLTPLMVPGMLGQGEYEQITGFGSAGVPPRGGACATIGQVFDDNPYSGWPLQFRTCDWAIISAYFCTPNYFPGYTHWGMDFASYWSADGGSESIYQAPILTTTEFARVVQAVYTKPPQHNHGMGNFVQIEAWIPRVDIDEPPAPPEPGMPTPTPRVVCSGDPRTDIANGMVTACWEPSKWKATYMHMYDLNVTEGDWVFRGDVLGRVNSTGNSTGHHLHYQINAPERGAVDPAPTLGCPGYDWQAGVNKGK